MRILVVDDELSMREYLDVLIQRWGHQVAVADSVPAALQLLKTDEFGVVVTDMKLGRDSGLNVLRAARAVAFPPEVIIITAFGTPATAIEAVREGAYDYISKPFDNEELRLLVERASEKRTIRSENLQLKQSLAEGKSVLGSSPVMAAVWNVVEKVAHSPRATVLVTGESGSGKELVARAIHQKSERAIHPFIPINCAALAEGVLESELFGHVKGAYTGATSDRQGLLVSAGNGTVFLDEIGEVSLPIQVKLLRVLQERMVKPVGGSSEVPFHARIVAATNKRLEEEVRHGRFREDLLYRLNVITIELPPLRERREDIPVLAKHFLAKCAEDLGRPSLRLTDETLKLLQGYAFPGNVRQLQNIIERAATLTDSDSISPAALPPALRGEAAAVYTKPGDLALGAGFSLEKYIDEQERAYLHQALTQAGGVRTKAAQLLGLTFRSFRYRLAKHGMSDPDDVQSLG